MIWFYTNIAVLFLIEIIGSTVSGMPNEVNDKNIARWVRGIFVPEPKELRNHDLVWIYNATNEGMDIAPVTTHAPTTTTLKKWQVGRVSRKQYEIINMIWRKTKIFLDVGTTPTTMETSTVKIKQITPLTRTKLQTTESFIEFYYLEENDKSNNEKNRSGLLTVEYIKNHPSKLHQQSSENFKPKINNSPFLLFHVNVSPQTKPHKPLAMTPSSLFPIHHTHKPNFHIHHAKSNYNNNKNEPFWDMLSLGHTTNKSRKRLKNNVLSDDYKGETCPITTEPIIDITVETNSTEDLTEETTTVENSYTTIYDKIKFFELYDRHTRINKKISEDYQDNNIAENINYLKDSRDNHKTLLEHVDVNTGHNDGVHNKKFAKKLVNRDTFIHHNISTTSTSKPVQAINDYFTRLKLNTSNSTFKISPKVYEATKPETYYISKTASWSRYSFAAVYVYEPSQILCDAAAISNHWLITAGSCLSRQHFLEPTGDGRSAFVTYCGPTWRQPERIAYVKYTLVHPKFHPRERSRRFQYNIGVIQVVSSLMSACSGWAPISLMSHQFSTDLEGTMASAVGWGLDRYAAKFPDDEIPAHPLKVYKGVIHSDDCPGNIGYSDAKQVEPINVMKNVYCLSLPPYKSEEYDPVHGSLLLVGGKLIALYLQEERRSWGDQSAQYTGVWRLIPWVLEVAREPEDIEAFTADV